MKTFPAGLFKIVGICARANVKRTELVKVFKSQPMKLYMKEKPPGS